MKTVIKTLLGVEVPMEFEKNIDLAIAYVAGVLRANDPEKLNSHMELREVDNEFRDKTNHILVEAPSSYRFSKGKEFIERARAYCSGININRKLPGKFDPKNLTIKNIPWSRKYGESSFSSGRTGPDLVTQINEIHRDPSMASILFTHPRGEEIYHQGLPYSDPEFNEIGIDIGRIRVRESDLDFLGELNG